MNSGPNITGARTEDIISEAATILPGARRPDFVLTCEHASWRVPTPWHDLGLSADLLRQHIGWDIGAAEVTRELSALMRAPAFLAGYSRLFVECNRMPTAPDFVAAQSAGIHIPGNQGVTADEISLRKKVAYDPFHKAISDYLDQLEEHKIRPILISVHSFTPNLGDEARPWHAGVLWKEDSDLPLALHREMSKQHEGLIGLNSPYDPHKVETMTLDYHALPRGLPHVVLEIRNDLINDGKGALYWSKLIADSLTALKAMS